MKDSVSKRNTKKMLLRKIKELRTEVTDGVVEKSPLMLIKGVIEERIKESDKKGILAQIESYSRFVEYYTSARDQTAEYRKFMERFVGENPTLNLKQNISKIREDEMKFDGMVDQYRITLNNFKNLKESVDYLEQLIIRGDKIGNILMNSLKTKHGNLEGLSSNSIFIKTFIMLLFSEMEVEEISLHYLKMTEGVDLDELF